MLLILIPALLILCIPGAKIARRGEFFDSLDRNYTGAVRGVFAVLIIFSHMLGYVDPVSAGDRIFSAAIGAFGQFTVVMFFFFSGAGVAISQAKNRDYRRTLFTRRILRTWLNFALAVALYIPVAYLLGRQYPLSQYALAFTGWSTIGNSNWFVFAILALYLMTLLAFAVFPDKPLCSAAAVTVLCVGYILLMREYKGDGYWYNTVLCYPLGMLAATVRPGEKKYALRLLGAALITAAPMIAYLLMPKLDFQLCYTVTNIGFAYLAYLIGMKVRIGNKVLASLGTWSFGIYVLQRLPMRLLDHYLPGLEPIVFALISITAAIALAVPYTKLTDALGNALFSRKASRR